MFIYIFKIILSLENNYQKGELVLVGVLARHHSPPTNQYLVFISYSLKIPLF